LRILEAFLLSRGPAWLGGTFLNSFALVLTTRPALALPSGWSGWLAYAGGRLGLVAMASWAYYKHEKIHFFMEACIKEDD